MKNEKILNAFMETIAEMNARIDELKDYVENHMGVDSDAVNWGNVGSAQAMLAALTQLTDKAYHRGEFAE